MTETSIMTVPNDIVTVEDDSKDLRKNKLKCNNTNTGTIDYDSLSKTHRPKANKSLSSNFPSGLVNVDDKSKHLGVEKSKSIKGITDYDLLSKNHRLKPNKSSQSKFPNDINNVKDDSKDLRMNKLKSTKTNAGITDYNPLSTNHKPKVNKSLRSNLPSEIKNVEDNSKNLRVKKSKRPNTNTGITDYNSLSTNHKPTANEPTKSNFLNEVNKVEDDSKDARVKKSKSDNTNIGITDYNSLSTNHKPKANRPLQSNFSNPSMKKKLNWIKGEVGKLEWNFDLITEEESNKRLLKFFAITSVLLLVISTILLTKNIESRSFNTLQSEWFKKAPKNTESKGFPRYHLNVLLKNGSVWDLTFNNNFSLMKKRLLLQLPEIEYINSLQSENYFAFVTNSRVVNFVRNDLSAVFQSQIGSNSYVKIKGSFLNFKNHGKRLVVDRFIFRHAIQVGNRFWMLEGRYRGE